MAEDRATHGAVAGMAEVPETQEQFFRRPDQAVDRMVKHYELNVFREPL
jgi:hypothetical protein